MGPLPSFTGATFWYARGMILYDRTLSHMDHSNDVPNTIVFISMLYQHVHLNVTGHYHLILYKWKNTEYNCVKFVSVNCLMSTAVRH